MSVLNSKALHEQLCLIMGALTKAAVAEICELVDEGYAVLQLEISRSHKENEDLKKKMHLIESIVVRSSSGGQTAEDTGLTEAVQQPETQPQQRAEAAAASGGNARVEREELSEVVLIKDEDSDCDDAVEEDSGPPADVGAAAVRGSFPPTPTSQRRRRRCSRGSSEDAEKSSSSSDYQQTVGAKTKVTVYHVDSPRSEALMENIQMEAGTSYTTEVDPDIQLVQDCSLVSPSSSRQMFYSSGARMEAQSSSARSELDLNAESAWSKQSKGFAQFHQSENMASDTFGLKLISVSGSTSTDCQLSNSRSSTFEYEDGGEVLTFGLYGGSTGTSQAGDQQSPGSMRKRFVCSICSKTYATAQNLEVHMRIHTGERPFTCDQCGKKFTQSAHLKSHHNVHTGERPFACQLCSKRFIVKYSLKLHMKKCGPQSSEDSESLQNVL
uniref:Si:dkey-7l6.3 n=1 Tax=Nothobranchius korthausae TaxID=1143690 RepID=A0A1A8FAX7_9TELE